MASCVDEISPLVAPLCTRFRSRIQNSLIYDRNVFSIPVVAQAVNKPNRSPLAMLGSTTQPTPWAKFIKTNWFSPINPLKQIVKNPFNKGTGIIPKEHWRELIFCNWQPLCMCTDNVWFWCPPPLESRRQIIEALSTRIYSHLDSDLLSTLPSLPVTMTVTILTSNMFFCFLQFWEKSHIKRFWNWTAALKWLVLNQNESKAKTMIF